MEKRFIPREKTTFFSDLANQINSHQENLTDFVREPFSRAAFQRQIELKKAAYSKEQRMRSYAIVKEQLSPFYHYEKVKRNVELLQEEATFTVTAGHQLNVFGGPLYSLYKIMDAVRLAEELTKEYPNQNFVPVFWMATEDHDFEEINHIHLFHDTLTWESRQQGAVGRFSVNDINDFKAQLLQKFENNPDFAQFLASFYENGDLATTTREFLMQLAGTYGVLIIDADHPEWKRSFIPLLKRELVEQFSEPLIVSQIKRLEEEGYHGQAKPRPVNLFYINEQERERIIPNGDATFQIGERTVSQAALLEELEQHPERFSPNVVWRPLYQEFILPNLCYLGGGGEMSYWLELKKMFEETGVPFPLIKVRNSIQWIDKNSLKKLKKLEIEPMRVFDAIDAVKKQYVFDHADGELDFTELNNQMGQLSQTLVEVVENVDKGLLGYGKSEATKLQNQLEKIKQKLVRHQKQKNDQAMQQIDTIYANLFPNNGMQERFENVIPFIAKQGVEAFVDAVYAAIDPFEQRLIVLLEE